MNISPAVTATLARQSTERRFDSLPPEVVTLAQQCLLDCLGVSILGSREALVEILVDEALERGAEGNSPLAGRAERLGLLDAALVNGSAAHALDYDDGNRAGGHLTAPVASALLPLAHHIDASGRDLVTAFVAGYELCARAGDLVQPDHYARGFHPTATLGTLGAAAGCARLLGLDAAQTEMALGIAATQAAGLIASFGTMCKPLHVGRAAMSGLLAARLAQRGFSGGDAILERPYGFAAAHSGDFHPDLALGEPVGGFHILANVFKFHAACAGTHATLDAIAELRAAHALTPEKIAAVTVRIHPGMDKVCNIGEPRTGLEVKFSVRMAAALALTGIDTSDPAIFTDALAQRADLLALRDRITVELSESVDKLAAAIDLRTTDGHTLAIAREGDRPATDIAAQGARVANKFLRLAGPVLGTGRSESVRERFESLAGESRLRELLALATA